MLSWGCQPGFFFDPYMEDDGMTPTILHKFTAPCGMSISTKRVLCWKWVAQFNREFGHLWMAKRIRLWLDHLELYSAMHLQVKHSKKIPKVCLFFWKNLVVAYYTPNVSLDMLQTIEQKENIFPKKWFHGNFTIVTRKNHLKIPKEQIQVTATGVSHKQNDSRRADHLSSFAEGSSVQICPANQWCIASLRVLGRDYEMQFFLTG